MNIKSQKILVIIVQMSDFTDFIDFTDELNKADKFSKVTVSHTRQQLLIRQQLFFMISQLCYSA